ncbi:MAG: polysaccharide biosynthesis tyrosine autokinase [Hyphomonadaceae bacterium]
MNKAYPLNIPPAYPAYPTSVGGNEDSLIDIQSLLQAGRRRFWLMAATFILIFSIVAVMSYQITPQFTSGSKVIVDSRKLNIAPVGDVLSGLTPTTAIIDTEVQVVKSRALLAKVAETMNLIEVPEFNGALQEPSGVTNFINNTKKFIKDIAPIGGSDDVETGPQPTREEIEASQFEGVVGALNQRVSVSRVGNTYIMEINVRSESPRLAAELANAIADQYLVEQLEAKFEATKRANTWLEEQLADLREDVRSAESAVEAYRAASGLTGTSNGTLTEQQISDLTGQLAVREAEKAEAEARLNNVRNQMARGAGPDSIAEVLSSPEIGDLRAQQAEVRRKRTTLQSRYGPLHPEVQDVINEEADLEVQIRSAMTRIVAKLEGEVLIARERVNSLKRSKNALQGTLNQNNRAQVRLRELERNASASRTLFEDFLARFKETSEQANRAEPDARVLSPATVPLYPSFPRTKINLLLGAILGGALAGALAMVAELLDNHFSTPEDVERMFQVPSIGQVPYLHGLSTFGIKKTTPPEYLVANPLSAFAESIRNLRASIIFSDLDREAKTVAVSSSLPDEGKTSLTYCLGRMSAISGAKTIIIDGDFRRRQLTEGVGIEPDTGFIEHLFGEVSLEDAIYIDEETGLHVLPLSEARNTPRDVFGSRAFDALLAKLKEEYEFIVIDTGPILMMAESRVVASKVDQVIVAAKWRSTSRNSLNQTLSILKEFNANIAGVVLTFVDVRRQGRHGYGNASYKSYSKYYTTG